MTAKPFLATLGDVVEFMNGGAWHESEYATEGVPVVRVSDVNDETIDLSECKFLPATSLRRYEKHILRTGDVIVCTVGSHPTQPNSVVGRVAIVPQIANRALLNQNAVRLRTSSPDVDQRWLSYVARSRPFHDYIISHARGAANQVRMAIGLLKAMPIQIPPLHAQRRVAAALSAYDDLVETSQRRAVVLDQMARAVYREWFVKFCHPGEQSPLRVPSALGDIPSNWRLTSVESLCSVVTRGVTPAYEAGSARFIINQKVNRGSHLSIRDLKELESSLVVPPDKFARFGDVLVNCLGEGTIGRVHLFAELHKDWAVDQHMSICRAASIADALYLYFALESPEGQARIASLKTGGTNMTMFNISALRSFPLIEPPSHLRDLFARRVLPMIQQKQTLVELVRKLRRTRDLLLPRLLSGQITLNGTAAA